ncbi:hypothetical protein [Planococcus sp. CAU13]|uniref:hypothetical protein n=1 Tax=Planococcus sp. CAU13 TaxID=1541197 RepID=UPI000530001E|nr:hypothetical protein [Planococcus sp. CAU13]
MKHLLGAGSLALVLLLAGCGGDEPEEPAVQIPPGSDTNVTDEDPEDVEQAEQVEEPGGDEIDPLAFFMDDGTTAQYEGDGNEFATLAIRTEHLMEDYVALYEDNGGTVMLKVYRLSDDRVDLVKEEPEFFDEYNPTLEELEALETISTYLEFPLEEGNTLDDRTVVQTGATVKTPYETFEDAIVLESRAENSTNRWHFIEGYGEVKREFISEEDGEEFTVTSSLESIE